MVRLSQTEILELHSQLKPIQTQQAQRIEAKAASLASGEPLISMARQNPSAVHHALEVLTETLKEHVSDVLERGSAGLFYAPLPWTSTDVCDAAFYAEFGKPYDLEVLASAEAAPFNHSWRAQRRRESVCASMT